MAIIAAGTSRLPVFGIGRYLHRIELTSTDVREDIFLDVEHVVAYAMLGLNGKLVGGWLDLCNSFRLSLRPRLGCDGVSVLAARLDNPVESAPRDAGGGIYRDVAGDGGEDS